MSKILVLDDERPILEEIVDTLMLEDFEVISTDNGPHGVQLAREHLPDLILCDIMMPGMDGYEVLTELRSDSSTALIPFIFLTAKATRADIRLGMEMGADDYLPKPFDNRELLAAVRTRLEKHLVSEKEQYRSFSQQLIAIQENERRQLAQVLRDDVLQILTSLKVTLGMSQQLPNQATYAETRRMVDELLAQIDMVVLDLWPTMLDHLGLLPALLWQFERFYHQTQIRIHFEHRGLERSFDPEIKLATFRILQQALANIAQHAGVYAATIRIWVEDNNLIVEMVDEGVGFDLDMALSSRNANGLLNMRERARAMNGDIMFTSAPGAGTEIILRLPLESKDGQPLRPLPHVETHVNRAHSTQIERPDTQNDETRIVLAIGHELFRRGLSSILAAHPGFTIVAEADSGAQTLKLVEQTRPEILIVDFVMPGLSGIDITQHIARTMPQTQVLLISTQTEEAYVLEAFKSGAAGYILKDSSANDLIEAVQEVRAGHRYLSAPLSERALDSYLSNRNTEKDDLDSFSILTRREREILQLVVQGYRNSEIAKALSISPRTAETHRANMIRKLGVRNQADLIRYALQRGLISDT